MSGIEFKCKLSDALRDSGDFAEAVKRLQAVHHGVFVGDGALLPTLIDAEAAEAPLLIIRSERVSEEWVNGSCWPEFAVDGCDNSFGASPYLVWGAGDVTLAVATIDISEALNAAAAHGIMLVAWVVGDSVIITPFTVNEDMMYDWYCMSRASQILLRFVPSDEYVESVHAGFPPLLSDAEQRFIGDQGEPTYVAELCG
jgi:hypothetical protein